MILKRYRWFALFAGTTLLSGCTSLPINAVELSSTTLSQGLVAHWRFDDGLGTNVLDSSGNRRNGALTGGTWLGDGQFAGALRLASGEFVTVNPFPNATSKFSVSAWVRISEYTQDTTELGQWGTIVSTEVGSTGGWELNVYHGYLSPALNFGLWKGPNQGDYDFATCLCLQLNQWTHVAAVVDNSVSTISLYVDGQLRATSVTQMGILPGSPTLDLGQWPAGGRYLVGDVDDIAVWNRALAPAEVGMLTSQAPPDPT